MTEGSTQVEVFCCYAHADEAWLRRLETHLSLLKRQGLISLWYDRLIPPGTDWAKTIDTHLETASVILLLPTRCATRRGEQRRRPVMRFEEALLSLTRNGQVRRTE